MRRSLPVLLLALGATPALAQDTILPERLPTRFLSDEEVIVEEPSNDLFLVGQQITVMAPVSDNLLVLGQEVSVEAPVNGDVFAMGQVVRIESPIAGDLYAFAQTLELGAGGSIAGNVFAAGETLQLDGPVGGDVEANAGQIYLNGPIGGDVKLTVGTARIGDQAMIGGDLAYDAPEPVANVDRAVEGDVVFTEWAEEIGEPDEEPGVVGTFFGWVGWTLWSYVAHLLVGFALLAIGGRAATRIGRTVHLQPGRALGLGFVLLAALPILSIAAIVTIIPMPLGFLGLATYAAALYAAEVFAAHALGDELLQRFRPGASGSPWMSMAVGLVPIVLLASLPWFGTLIWLVATCLGLGGVWMTLRDSETV